MIRARLFSLLAFSGLLLILFVAGCGASQQQYSKQQMVKVPPAEQLRGWLAGIAQTGELDSGTDWAKEKIAALDVPNKDKLVQEVNALGSAGDRRQVSARAKEMLKLLPAKQ